MNINGVTIPTAYWEWGHYGKSACTNALLVDWTRQENTCNARSIVTSSTKMHHLEYTWELEMFIL